MKAVQSVGLFSATSSTLVSTLSAIEAGASTVNQLTSWAHEEVEALRADRALKREVQRDLFKTGYILEAAAEVAAIHQQSAKQMESADAATKAVYEQLVTKYLR